MNNGALYDEKLTPFRIILNVWWSKFLSNLKKVHTSIVFSFWYSQTIFSVLFFSVKDEKVSPFLNLVSLLN